jgi:histone deacetylase 1/2
LFDELAAASRPVSLEDFNLYVFRGLREEFKDLVTSLITKAEPLSYTDLHSHLLMHEFLHKSSAAIHAPLLPTSSTPPSALVAQCHTSGNSGRSRGNFNSGWLPNQSSSRGNRFAGSRPNHRSFQSSSFGDSRQGSWQGNWQRNRGQNPRCQLCQNFSHIAPHCPQFQQWGYDQQSTANLVQRNLSSTGSVDWFPDTGANQHVTLDLATLIASEPYLCNDNLHVGDGKGLPISHLDHTKIYIPHRSFTLSNALHVPAITKSLLSVQKFCLDNNVYFEFHPRVIYVKDLNSHEVLFSGQSKDGLYVLTKSYVTSVPQAYWSLYTSVFADLWHRRLGHLLHVFFNY